MQITLAVLGVFQWNLVLKLAFELYSVTFLEILDSTLATFEHRQNCMKMYFLIIVVVVIIIIIIIVINFVKSALAVNLSTDFYLVRVRKSKEWMPSMMMPNKWRNWPIKEVFS